MYIYIIRVFWSLYICNNLSVCDLCVMTMDVALESHAKAEFVLLIIYIIRVFLSLYISHDLCVCMCDAVITRVLAKSSNKHGFVVIIINRI